ncbi:MAG: Hpt domain-containing protein [Gammaproteobacteria bacterium]
MAYDFDYGTLTWVKSEIDETLQQARSALEAFVDNTEDETKLRFCINYLHQVHGTLQMVELYGASLVAEEMEKLAQAIVDGKVIHKDDAYEALMRGMLQLPDYLDKVESGQQDMPLVLMPLLNDLRAARGEALLSENALFSPDLSIAAPAPESVGESEDLAQLARKLRHLYHLGLLGWFRDQNREASLQKIGDVIGQLRQAAREEESGRLLWAAGGVVEGLLDGGLESSVAVKLLLGQVDRQVKRVIDGGEVALSEEPPSDLIKNLLFYVAQSSSTGETVSALKSAFHLDELLPDAQAVDRARESLAGPNVSLLETVSKVILDDLSRIKDNLDIFVRSDDRDVATLKPLVDSLTQMADTLAMLGLGVQRKSVQAQTTVLSEMIAGERAVDDDTLMDVAGALLSVEGSLADVGRVRAANDEVEHAEELPSTDGISSEEIRVTDPEYHQVVQLAIGEAKTELARIKEAIAAYGNTPNDHELLQQVPQYLASIRGSLSMLNLDRAAELVDAWRYRDKKLAEGKTQREVMRLLKTYVARELYKTLRNLDLEAPAGAELSLEPAPDFASDSTVDSASLVEAMDMWLLDPTDSGATGLLRTVIEQLAEHVSSTGAAGADALSDLATRVERVAGGEVALDSSALAELTAARDAVVASLGGAAPPPPAAAGDEPTQIDLHALPQSPAVGIEASTPQEPGGLELEPLSGSELAPEPGPEAETPAAEPSSTPTSSESQGMSEIDDEIIEIFMEEADEELGNIGRLLPQWRDNPTDEEALKDLRRSYHTLKGSGRLVGATDIGEFAWAFENMLNRVIDHTIQAGPVMFDLLERALQALPQFFELFRTGAKPGQPLLLLMESAHALSQGLDIEMAPPTSESPGEEPAEENITLEAPPEPTDGAAQPASPAEPTAEAEAQATGRFDPVLLEIYRKETEGHLTHLRQVVADCRAGQRCTADDGLVRALHTLHGSSRTADIDFIADLGGKLERYAKLLQEKHLPLTQDAVNVLADSIDLIEQTVPLLAEVGASLPDSSALHERVDRLHQEAQSQSKRAVTDETPQPDPAPAPEHGTAEYDEELLDIFLEEGTEILDTSDETLRQWVDEPNNPDLVMTMQRELHTLKGGARMAGVTEIGDLSHKVESLLTAVADGHVDASKRLFDVLQLAQDRLVQMLEGVRDHTPLAPASDIIVAVEELLPGGGANGTHAEARIVAPEGVEKVDEPPTFEEPPSAEPAIPPSLRPQGASGTGAAPVPELTSDPAPNPAPPQPSEPGKDLTAAPPAGMEQPAGEAQTEGQGTEAPFLPKVEQPEEDDGSRDRRKGSRIQHEQVRVRADLLDNLVNFAGEVSIYRSRLEQQVNSFRFNLTELDETVARLREQLRQFEIETEAQIQHRYEEAGTRGYEDFDPLEFDRFTHMQQLSRSMLESLSDLDSLKGLLNNLTRESETLLLQQSRVNTDLQEGLMRSRMVPFAGQAPRLRRIVRQASHDLNKQAELQLVGAENELDRTVLDRVMAPLEHMLRNAIAHGIENPQQRTDAGKPPAGTIALALSREGSEIVIRVSDDGAGIDIDAIRRKAIARGRIEADSQMTEEALLDLILESGFSTAETITQIAGRGVGMDVVNSEIKQLGGTLTIDTRKGQGTLFTVRLPLTLSVTRALMVNAGEETFAVPLLSVEGIERISHEELAALFSGEKPVYDWLGEEYAFMHLGSVMGLSEPTLPGEGKKAPLLLTRSGDYRAALSVDGLIGSREVVVKSVGPQLATLHGISGATIMGDGTVVLILDLGMLIRHGITHEARAVIDVTAEREVEEEHIPTVMVVDDSITVRKVTARLLERNNMNVMTAKDGVDALALLQEQVPDLMLLDIEMPRMDGFELATTVRNDERLRDVPIIMITSRTGAKHRERAMNIGVNSYMGKPFQESELLENIQELLAE